MKKLILIILVILLPVSIVLAQTGEIIYKDFDPDTCQFIRNDSLKIDVDGDGLFDMWISGFVQCGALIPVIYTMPGWKMCPSNENTVLSSDTLVWLQHEIGYNNNVFTGEYFQKSIGLRKQVGDVFFYGWMFTYYAFEIDPNIIGRNVYIDKFAYCTIPNYPLRWGQTEILDVEENEASAFAVVHPNPTTGLVAITGENLRQAEAFNTLGQKVLNAQGEGNELHIDMTALPAGIYFVAITDEEGRKCVRKVVKH